MKRWILIVLICLSGYVFGQEKVNYYERYEVFYSTMSDFMDTAFSDYSYKTIETVLYWNTLLLKEPTITTDTLETLYEFNTLLNSILDHSTVINAIYANYLKEYLVYKQNVNATNIYTSNKLLEAIINEFAPWFNRYFKLSNRYNKYIHLWHSSILYPTYREQYSLPRIQLLPSLTDILKL
jgi:hypothetical protein